MIFFCVGTCYVLRWIWCLWCYYIHTGQPSIPTVPVARHIFQAGRCGYTLRVTSQTSLIHYFKLLKNIRMFLYKRRFASRIYRIRVRVVSNIGYNLSSSTRYNTVAHALSILIFQKPHKDIVIILTYCRVTKMNYVKLLWNDNEKFVKSHFTTNRTIGTMILVTVTTQYKVRYKPCMHEKLRDNNYRFIYKQSTCIPTENSRNLATKNRGKLCKIFSDSPVQLSWSRSVRFTKQCTIRYFDSVICYCKFTKDKTKGVAQGQRPPILIPGNFDWACDTYLNNHMMQKPKSCTHDFYCIYYQ
jgi:hypothetical protein